MADWIQAIPNLLIYRDEVCHGISVYLGGCAGMAIAGPIGAKLGGIAGGIVIDIGKTTYDSIRRREYSPYGYLRHVKMIKNSRTLREGFWNIGKMMISINADKNVGHMAGTLMPSSYNGEIKRKYNDEKENSESIKEESDKTNNVDRDTHAQPTSSNADASEGEKAPSTSSGPDAFEAEKAPSTSSGPGVPGCEMKGPSHPELMPQKSRKRPFSDPDLMFQAIKRIKPSTAALY